MLKDHHLCWSLVWVARQGNQQETMPP